jgi:hypothetical protein
MTSQAFRWSTRCSTGLMPRRKHRAKGRAKEAVHHASAAGLKLFAVQCHAFPPLAPSLRNHRHLNKMLGIGNSITVRTTAFPWSFQSSPTAEVQVKPTAFCNCVGAIYYCASRQQLSVLVLSVAAPNKTNRTVHNDNGCGHTKRTTGAFPL